MTEIIGLLAHHTLGPLRYGFRGIFDWEHAYKIAIEKIIPKLRQSVYQLPMRGLIYPFMAEPEYDPHELANKLAVAAVALNQGTYEIIEDTPFSTAMIYPDIICRGCGNLIQKGSLREYFSGYYCASRSRQIEFYRLHGQNICGGLIYPEHSTDIFSRRPRENISE